ncbi:MAG: DUF1648 domain-containing protein [Candidatus Marinimicrobia bacterium]|nr:DUF1648 domain-containing protein [Candidatus Neomarinimicrobiota bacterium]
MSNFARWIYLLMVAISFAHLFIYYPDLPDTVAIHFGISGEPDNWADKTGYLAFEIGLLTFLTLIFVGIAESIKKFPPGLFNIPNKEYWLAGERQHETAKTIKNLLYWVGNITLFLLLYMNHQLVQVNIQQSTDSIDGFWIALIAYLSAIGLLLYQYLKKFYRTPG